ncbi:immune inhibitor A domain-containing protein [Kitasatospora aureofaciens]|uniref:Protease n=1 Tax=Kitasatospora aureofaciens TaxID=1894 RepID=A0A1E7N6S8_KITAU|nr:immune inhibitor A domain-containing protein [Kitasatospora aureofaciens]OEV36163.1 protease [Kitasatospora aureofaciens]UKZ07332.1 immune inhibitor A [Streptomyces viridifaciens]GGU87053.1 protease [Kitasatospora aureofaciens]
MKTTRRAAAVTTAAAVIVTLGAGLFPSSAVAAGSAPVPKDPADAVQGVNTEHNIPGPLTAKVDAEKKAATEQLLNGTAQVEQHNGSTSVKLGKDKYVELARERTDKIFTILVDFGDQVDNTTKTADGKVKYGGEAGPKHNEIEAPDRATNNSTAWQADYNQQHYQDLYFSKDKPSLKTFYEKQSSGRYSVDGVVSDWVRVPWNEARYGSDYCGSNVCASAQDLIRDAVDIWYKDQLAKGQTEAQIKATLAQYDQWDRYGSHHDGNFNQPDGYIDHFQIVHAGEDKSAGGGKQGSKALWAHRSYVYGNLTGQAGPDGNKLGGVQVGNTGLWIGDYTMQPENGGLGVFAHEYGHDLGLPDLYDTAGKGIDNSVGFWSLMSSGSWLGEGKDSIGDMPNDLDAWSKYQLGWLKVDRAKAGTESTHHIGPVEYNSNLPQALIVDLPKKSITTDINKPFAGGSEWWSGSADNLNVTLTRDIDLTGKTKAGINAKAWYELEPDFDYAFGEVSTDGGKTWTVVDGTWNGAALPKENGRPALSGLTAAWGDLSFNLDAYAGKKIQFRYHNTTDGGLHYRGFAVDNVAVVADGATLFSDDVEHGDNGWTAAGFTRFGGSYTKDYAQYYIAENKQYVSFDQTLKTGPYNFGSAAKPNWVEHYSYQPGLLIWYWDESQTDNNVSAHPGHGLVLPVDSHPAPMKWSDGTLMRPRMQGFDSTFGSRRVPALTLHKADVETVIPKSKGVDEFNDLKSWWSKDDQYAGVDVPKTGTSIEVENESANYLETWIRVRPVDN